MFRGPRHQLGSVAQSGAGPDVVGVVIDATGREPAPDAPDDRRGARALLGGRRTPIGPGRRAANCGYPDRRDWRGGKFVWFSTVRSITFRVGTPPDASALSRSTTSQSSPANPVPAVPSGPPIPRSPQARTTRIPTSPRSLAGWTGPWSVTATQAARIDNRSRVPSLAPRVSAGQVWQSFSGQVELQELDA